MNNTLLYKMALERTYFQGTPQEVAKGLLGRTLYVRSPTGDTKSVTVTEVGAYEGETDQSSEHLEDIAGTVSISVRMGKHCMFDIATGTQGHPACITIRGAEYNLEDNVKKATGPANVCKALGIDKDSRDLYANKSAAGEYVWFDGQPVHPTRIKKKTGNSANCKGIFVI